MKKFLSIMLSILMVVTMLPMAVMPAFAAATNKNLTLGIRLYMDEGLCSHNEQQPVDTIYVSTSLGYKEEYRLTYEYSDNDLVIEYYYGVSHAGHSDDGVRTSFTVPDFSCEKTYNQKFTTANGSIVTFKRSAGHAVSSWTNNNNGTHSGTCSFCGAVTVNCTYSEATCVAPKTCIACGATKGDIDATAHSWANLDGICANGCGATCAHENQTGSVCEICGADIHLCSYNNGFCTECDAYEPAELKDGYYQIKNGGNLFWYANYINTVDRTANAVLTADIDLENRPWTPIGSTGENSNNFRGIFDGQNYIIRGLYVEGDRAGLGFFGEVRTGTVKNFTIYGEVVVNTEVDYVGGVIGSICGVNGENDLERNGAIIQNIKSFVNLTVKAHGVGKIGGFVGYANHQSLIEKCSWYGTFDAGEYRVDSGAGGFIGKIQENSSEVTIRNCAAYGTIKTNYAGDYNDTATIYMGGFLSFSNTNAKTTLENCLFAGRFERGENLTDEAFLGAFGTLRSVNAIKNCYYLGDDGLEAVHSDSNLKPGSDNVEITKATGEELKKGTVAKKLGEYWEQGVHYPTLKDHFAHWGSETYTYTDNGDGTHDMVCTGCGYVEVYNEAHSGGTATCTEQAKCKHCGASYGELDPDNHEYENGFCLPCNSYEKPAIEPGEYDDETWDDTYLISNAGQLYWLAEYVNNVNNEAHAALTADITVPETAPNWVPIGGYYQWTPYTGYFDGRMHTISGLKCETEGYYAGLFGYTDYGNEIKNVGVINSSFKGIDKVGGLIGSSYSYVKNCYVADTTVEGTGYDIGTLIGYNGNEVSNCYTDGGTLIGGDSGTTTNSYYLSETETEDGGKTEAQFASGEVAYLLQNGVSGEDVYDDEGNYVETVVPHIWGQKIDTDTYPVLGGDKVYQVSDCKNAEAYSNVDKDLGHKYVNGICTVCGEVCGHTGGTATCTEKAVCEICGEKYGETLAHTDEDSNEFCDVCGKLINAKVLTSVGGYLYIDGVKIEPNGTRQDLPSGKYVLTGDISTYWTIREVAGESITLDLNGYVWNMGSSHLLLNGAFSLYDTSENETGKIVSSWNGTTIDLNNEACEFNLYGGTVENTSEDTAAKALDSRYGTTNLYGGKLKGKAYAMTCIENNGVKVNLEGASLECGEDFAHINMLIDDTSSPAILDVTGYTGEALDVEVNTNTAGKFEIIEGITNAEEAEEYQIRFSSYDGELFLTKTEYDEETGAMYAYIEHNSFTQQATADNNYTVTFNNPAATFQWYEIESEDLGTYSVQTEGELFTYEVKAGSIITVSTDSELEYIRILGIGGDEVWLSDTNKSVNVKFDSDTTINVYSSMQSPRTAIELKFSVVNETLLDGETGETLQNPECGKTYWCKATEGSIVYTSDTVSVTHNGEATCTDNGDGTHSAVYPCCGAIVAEVPHTLDVTTGKCSACGADMTVIATVTDSTNTYYAADAATLNQAVTAILETGSRTFTVELPADTEAEMITAIRRAICDTEGVADGSINLTLKGVTSIPGTTNWDGVAFGPGDIYDEAGEIVDQELVTQLASVNLPDATEIGAQAFYFCENLVEVSAPKAQTIGENAFAYTALTSVEFPELTAIPGTMLGGTWTLSSAKFPKVTTIEQNGLMIGFGFAPENNPTAFPLELTAEGDITFNGSNHFNTASQNYSGKVDLVLCCDKKDAVTFQEDGTATWQVREDLSYTFKSITFKHSYTDGVCDNCEYACPHENETGDTCSVCGATIKFATITGVSINVDGVIYTSDNTSAENPAVINPDSVVTVTVTGENFDLLPTEPENAVIGFTYFSQNLECLYNNPSKFDIDTVNNTVSFPANYDVLSKAITASELTYTNDDWYTDIGSGVYVIYIDKKDIADTLITLDNTEFIYSGNPIEPTVLVMADGQALMEGEHYTLTFESNVNAGTASVTVKGIGDYTGEVTKDFTITKAYYNLTAPTPDTLTYKGEDQYLVSAGTVEGADFEYSLDGVSWSTSIPQGKDEGNYTVYYRVLADENHYGIEGTVDVTIKECPHEWNDGVLTRPVYDAVLGSKDGYYTYTCTLCCEEKTEAVKSANYSAYEAVSEEINVLLQSDELTDAARQAIYSAANECGHLSNDLTESEQNIVDDLVAELEKIVADAEEKIASGEYVKIDGIKEYNKIAGALDAELMENYSQEEIVALAEKAGDEINARLDEIIEKAEALTGSVAENKDALAEIESEMKVLYGEIKNCLDGVHNGFVYEVTEEAKCEVNAIESATCTLCGETDEREVEGSALEHSFTKYEEIEAPKCGKAGKEVAYCDHGCGATDEKEIPALEHIDEDGDYLCDHGCGHEFEKPAEPDTPDTPDEPDTPDIPDEPTDEACDHLCHKDGLLGFFWKIACFFFRLFNIQQYCDCGELHYEKAIIV